jgi:hypothetical protein
MNVENMRHGAKIKKAIFDIDPFSTRSKNYSYTY